MSFPNLADPTGQGAVNVFAKNSLDGSWLNARDFPRGKIFYAVCNDEPRPKAFRISGYAKNNQVVGIELFDGWTKTFHREKWKDFGDWIVTKFCEMYKYVDEI